jgi:hypothetical protein
MAYASQSGRARTSSSSPQAHAICDRCGFRYNHVDLQWQHDWRGAALQNVRILVCNSCLDVPQDQLRAIVVPADPTPIMQARTQDFATAETDYQTVTAPPVIDPTTGIPIPVNVTLVTQNGQNLLTQQVGPPTGLDQGAIMPLVGKEHFDVKLNPLSVSSIGTDQISVTFSAAHGLVTDAQISVQGLANVKACGFYSITVTTATAFTYQTNTAIPAASLLTATTNMVTALVGLPYGFTQIPQTGI